MKTRILAIGVVAFFSLNSAFADLSVPQSTPSCVPPPADLVSWWRGEGNANDSVGTNNGTAIGGVSYTNGEVGQAFQLDGTSGYVDVPASGSLNVGTNSGLTIEGWIKPNDVSAQHPLVEYKFDGIQSGVHLWLTAGGVGSLFANIVDVNNGAHFIVSAPGIVQTGVFQHVALTYDRTTGIASLYYNGSVVVTANLGIFTPKTTTDLLLGRRIDAGSGYYFSGILDEISLYKRALSSNEIMAIYEAGSGGKCSSPAPCTPPPSNLTSWWRAEGNANDTIGTNNGTVVGGVNYTNGEVGRAFQMDGTSGYISIPPSSSLNIGTGSGVTIEGWIKPNDPSQIGMPVVEWDATSNSGPDGLQLWVESSFRLFGNVKDTMGNNHTFYSANGVVSDGIFQHVALTYDKNSGKAFLYLNGNPVASANFGNITPQTTYPLFLGFRTFTSEHFRGLLDEVSLYNRALSSSEIMAIYLAGSPGKCPPSPPSCATPPSGLISWWPGEDNANDVVGTNDGTLVDGVTFSTGKVGQAFHLDGTNQYVQIPDSPSLKPTNVSVEAWVKLDTLVTPGANIPGQQIIVFKKNTRSGNFEGYVLLKDRVGGTDCFSFAIASAGGLQIHALSTTVPQVGVWYHLVGTYDGATVRLYVNGLLEGSAFAGFPLDYGTRPVFFGRTGEFWVANFGGSIDEVSLYNRALTPEEILSLYDAGAAGKCTSSCVPPPSDLVSWWPAEGNGNDIVGTNNGIVSGNLSYAPGEVGQAFVFNDGTADVRIPASTSINVGLGNGFTAEAWISPTTLAPQPVFEWNSGTGYDDIGAHLWISGGPSGPGPAGNLYANVRDNVGVSHFIMSAGDVVVSNHLQHVALTYDKASGIAVLYRNGVAVQTQTLGVFTPKTDYDMHLGRRIGGYYSGAYYLGSIDEASLYKRALSASEIQAIYNAGAAGKCVPLVAPIILVQPQGQTVNAGDTATFSVTAEGSLPLFYQWFLNSNALAGATSTTLTLTNTQPDQGGWYSVVVSNAVGVAASSNALLRVNQIPVADASATVTRVFVCACTYTNTAVVLNGTRSYDLDGDPLQYLWFENGMSVPLATGAVAVVMLPPGTYPIDLVVSDGMAADTNVVVVKVLTATGAIGDLIALINGSDVAHPQPLIASLSAASDSIARCNLTAAVNQLGAFQNKVLAQIAPDDSALAGVLIASAQEIINSLDNCGGFQGQKHGKITANRGQQDNKVHLKFAGNRGQSYIIEVSSDLAHWEKIGVATDLQDGNFEFDDNNLKVAPVRFYRVITP